MPRQTLWPITIDYFDRMPKAAREALANSRVIGNGDYRMRIARDKGEIMAARIAAADAMLCKESNMDRPRAALADINAVLQGRQLL